MNADRWFPNCETMGFIDSIDATYCIRARTNFSIHIDDYEYSDLIGSLNDIASYFEAFSSCDFLSKFYI